MHTGGTGIAEMPVKGTTVHELSAARNLVELIQKEIPPRYAVVSAACQNTNGGSCRDWQGIPRVLLRGCH